MEVYVVIVEWVIKGMDGLTCAGVYDTFSKAQKVFEKEMETARKAIDIENATEDAYAEGDMAWSIWEDGNYSKNHVSLRIVQKTVQ